MVVPLTCGLFDTVEGLGKLNVVRRVPVGWVLMLMQRAVFVVPPLWYLHVYGIVDR